MQAQPARPAMARSHHGHMAAPPRRRAAAVRAGPEGPDSKLEMLAIMALGSGMGGIITETYKAWLQHACAAGGAHNAGGARGAGGRLRG